MIKFFIFLLSILAFGCQAYTLKQQNTGQSWNGQQQGWHQIYNPYNSYYNNPCQLCNQYPWNNWPQNQQNWNNWPQNQQNWNNWPQNQQNWNNWPQNQQNWNNWPQNQQNQQQGWAQTQQNQQSPYQQQWPNQQNGNNFQQTPNTFQQSPYQQQWPNQPGQQNSWQTSIQNVQPSNPMNSPQVQQGCVNEVQKCLSNDQDYWYAFQSIENNPVLTKEDISNQKSTLIKRLSNDVQKCYNDAVKAEEKCKQQTKKSIGNLSSSTQTAYNKIKKIEEKKNITKNEEVGQIQKILSELDSNTMQELYSKIPCLMKYSPQNSYGNQQQWNGR